MTGLVATLGSGAMTNPIPDIANSDCLFIIGSNLAEAHPIVSQWVWDAKERGARVIVADPRYTPTGWMADLFLRLNPGTDITLINGMMNIIIKENLHNREFIEKRTTGFSQLQKTVARYDLGSVEKITGVPALQIQQAARQFAGAKASAIIYCQGITEHTFGHDNVVNLANLGLICGQIGRPGTGVLPLRGQNNVQGACDMGALYNYLPGYVQVTDDTNRRRIAKQWGLNDLPGRPGLSLTEMFDAAINGKIKGMYIMGENPMVTDPDTHHVEEALNSLEFLVVQEIFLTETAEMADIVLPAAYWAEIEGSVTGTERRVQWMSKAIDPMDGTRPNWQIICEIGRKLGFNFRYTGPDEILREVSKVVPSFGGITPERLKEKVGGIQWPCPAPDHPGTPILHIEKFTTPDGLARLIPVEQKSPIEKTSEEYPLVLTTGRMVLHYNSGSMTRRSPSLLKRSPEPYVEINPADAQRLGIVNNEEVKVISRRGDAIVKADITDKVPPGLVFTHFHFPGLNVLTLHDLDPIAKVPEYKYAACRIEKRG